MEWINIVRKLNDKLAKKAQWARAWRNSARQFRSMFQGASLEWEAERDRYQEARKDNDGWITCYWQAISQRDEAVERLLYHKKRADKRGALIRDMAQTRSGMNTRMRMLRKRIFDLEETGSLDHENKRISELEEICKSLYSALLDGNKQWWKQKNRGNALETALDEARRLAIHYKQKADERGEWMGNRLLAAASENRRRRELEKRISVLEATCREARRWAINYMRRLEEKMAYKATGDDDEQKAA